MAEHEVWDRQRGVLAAHMVEDACRRLDGQCVGRRLYVCVRCDRCGEGEELGLEEHAEPLASPPGWACFMIEWSKSGKRWPVTLCPGCVVAAFEGWRIPPPPYG